MLTTEINNIVLWDCYVSLSYAGPYIYDTRIWSSPLFSLQWRHNGRDGVSNHQPHNCLLKCLSGADQRKHQSSASLAFVRGIHRWPVNSPHKWPVTLKMFLLDDVIMLIVSVIKGTRPSTSSVLTTFLGIFCPSFATYCDIYAFRSQDDVNHNGSWNNEKYRGVSSVQQALLSSLAVSLHIINPRITVIFNINSLHAAHAKFSLS